MIPNLSRQHISGITRRALHDGLIREDDTAVIFQDLDYLGSRITYLKSCFPASTLHGLAIKSNPLLRILGFTREMGTGVEAATIGEVHIALQAGHLPGQIVFDSPVKTDSDLRFALMTGVHLNCDNLEELKRVDILLKEIPSTSSIGIRFNPQVGTGTIAGSGVAGEYSKFGVPVGSMRNELEKACMAYEWLTGLHLHVGSQGCPMELLVNGAGILYDFACGINARRNAKAMPAFTVFDIGGGLPVSYHFDKVPPLMEDYVDALKKRAPGLFGIEPDNRSNDPVPWKLITEFGRWVFVNSGWTVSRVEYVKREAGISTAMIHVGADLFIRECLNPDDWSHEYSVLDPSGGLKGGVDERPYNLAGPLCFAGDMLAREVLLPPVAEGDFLVVHDTGGYTFSMWSRYNSRQMPRILGLKNGRLILLKERESFEDVVRFWR